MQLPVRSFEIISILWRIGISASVLFLEVSVPSEIYQRGPCPTMFLAYVMDLYLLSIHKGDIVMNSFGSLGCVCVMRGTGRVCIDLFLWRFFVKLKFVYLVVWAFVFDFIFFFFFG